MIRLGFAALAAAFALAPGFALAQDDMSDVEIRAEHVRGNVHVLFGRGGNIGVLTTPEGVVLIDDQFAPLTDKVRAAVAEISDAPIRFVINTHWHGDHTGGNENLGKAGVLILAHDNVHARMSTDQEMPAFNRSVPAAPKAAQPVITYNDELSIRLGEQARAHHVPHGHTDGDSIIHFPDSNAMHMGDLFFKGRYPFIDIGSGGNILGMIAGVETALGIADDDTGIIPGHGSLANRTDLIAFRDMLVAARDRVAALIEDGKSLEDIQAARPMADYDENWGSGFIDPDRFLKQVHDSLTRRHH